MSSASAPDSTVESARTHDEATQPAPSQSPPAPSPSRPSPRPRAGRALILYTTQTGTSSMLAHDLHDALLRLRLHPVVSSFAAFSPSLSTLPTYPLVFLLVSTTGQGELPSSAAGFWRRLCRRKIPLTWLADTHFSLFALGDKTYPKFCWAGKMVGRRVLQLGARELTQRVEADAGSEEGTDGAFQRWVGAIRELLEPNEEEGGEIGEDVLLPPSPLIGEKQDEEEYEVVTAKVLENRRITAVDHFQDTRLIRFRISPSAPLWKPGATVCVAPTNHPDDVALFFSLQPHLASLAGQPFPTPTSSTTLEYWVIYRLHLTSIPSRRFFALAAHFTSDAQHAERLREFADPQWLEELWDYTTRPRRTLLEVLQEFGSVRIPVEYLTSLVPPLRGRWFSIANAGGERIDGGSVLELLVAIVRYRTVIKKDRWGVCTRYLAGLQKGESIELRFDLGDLTAGFPPTRNILMIAPGTGVAPMRALIQYRYLELQGGRLKENAQKDVLFFGCRSPAADFYFESEWEKYEDALRVVTAFSRHEKRKVYVQQKIRDAAEEVWRVLGEQEGMVVVCGSSGRMPQAVREALTEAAERCGKMQREEAEKWFEDLERAGRYRQETW